ncbi:MAG: hypothetical protein CYG59_22845 [Chloroflexi bacterium]|nr:MAG: hypothetical protein CYG59_22845 [Chloroflexota bacterium]
MLVTLIVAAASAVVFFILGCWVGAILVGLDEGWRLAKAQHQEFVKLQLVDHAYLSAKQRMLDADIQRRYGRRQ